MPTAFVSPQGLTPQNLFTDDDFARQRAFFAAHTELSPTPLQRCPALARHLGIGELLAKDETARFGLNAFKAAGALFAVATLRDRGELRRGDIIVCASEGNHGRAVAHAAREVGCAAKVYMSNLVTTARIAAIRAEGAEVISVKGSYDEAVRLMAADAAARGWTVVSDTSWPGYTEIPRLIMLGYTRILDEIAEQMGEAAPRRTVFFVPAGVGGLLAAVACWGAWRYRAERPRVVAVEPASAACVQASLRAGRPTTVAGPFDTVMGGLRCGVMSPSVFPTAETLVDACVGIEDDYAFEAMRLMARPAPPDPPIECGPSGAAALGGLLAVVAESALGELRRHLQLGPETRAIVMVTEGVTEPQIYHEAVGAPPTPLVP
jgi:diaminopropionate ammonia-lyase